MFGTGRGTPRLAAVALAAAGLLAAGCGGSGGSGSSASTAAAAAASSPASASSSSSSSSSATSTPASSATAAPGTKLKVGQPATVAFHPAGASDKSKDSTLQLTITSFDKGSLADFNGVSLDATQKSATPYYVKLHLVNQGPHPIDVTAASAAIEGVDTTGSTQQSVTFIGDFPRCNDASTSTPLAPGKSFDSCLTFLIPGGIAKVAYSGTDSYIDSPVTWGP